MVASPSTTRARRADARLLHHVLDAPTQFGAPPQKKIFAACGLTPRPTQNRWHSFGGYLKPEQNGDRLENQIIGQIPWIGRPSPASLGGSLRTGAGGVRSDYLLVGVDMTGRVAGAWMHEKLG